MMEMEGLRSRRRCVGGVGGDEGLGEWGGGGGGGSESLGERGRDVSRCTARDVSVQER